MIDKQNRTVGSLVDRLRDAQERLRQSEERYDIVMRAIK
jgi:hypothetical protein